MKSQISQKQRAAILGLSAKGMKAPEIAKKLALSMPAVRSIIIRHDRADSWTSKPMTPFEKARIAEAQSKAALKAYCEGHGWKFAFFEGKTGAPRTGIIDAVMFRLGKKDSDILDLRVIQLKGGNAGISAREIGRLKKAAENATVDWLIVEYDGETLQFLPDDPA